MEAKKSNQPWNFVLANVVFCLSGTLSLGIAIWSAAHGGAGISGICFASGLVLLFAGSIDRFESLKGLGIEAKTRQLDQKITEATVVLARLRELSELVGETLIVFQTKVGRFSGPPTPREAYDTAQKIKALLKGVGSEPAQIQHALRPWVAQFTGDMAAALYRPVGAAQGELTVKLQSELRDAQMGRDDAKAEKIGPEFDAVLAYNSNSNHVYEMASNDPEQFLKFITEAPVAKAGQIQSVIAVIRDRVRDMHHLAEHMELPHPDEWIQTIDAAREASQRFPGMHMVTTRSPATPK